MKFSNAQLQIQQVQLQNIFQTIISKKEAKKLSQKLMETLGFHELFNLDNMQLQKLFINEEITKGEKGEKLYKHFVLVKETLEVFLDIPYRIYETNLSNHEETISYLRKEIGFKQRETFGVLLLDGKNNLLGCEILFQGARDVTQIYVKELMEIIFQKAARKFIMFHNHPSGDPKPSEDDIRMTNRVKELSSDIGLEYIDHLIITSKYAYSIKHMEII